MEHFITDLIFPKEDYHDSVKLTGDHSLTLKEIISTAYATPHIQLSPTDAVLDRQNKIIEHLHAQINDGTPIYGVSASYGGRADHLVNQGDSEKKWQDSKKLSAAIVHVDVSTGEPLPKEVTRAAMLIRLNMLLPGYSGVRLETLQLLADLLNKELTPVVGRYGTVGASGDLAQNGRILSALRQLENTWATDKHGNKDLVKNLFPKHDMKTLVLDPKEGLGMVNGDNFSTAAAALIAHELSNLWMLNAGIMSLTIQALKGSVRDFHPLLTHIRPHPGQIFTAKLLRNFLKDSSLAHQELSGHTLRTKGESVQDPYSIRCLPQYFGPDLERLSASIETIERNANSVSDNPLWTTPETVTEGEDPYQWVSGGNFLAMHMSEALDSMRKFAVHIVKQNDRHLARLIHRNLNNGLPPNLSDEEAISQCTFKGLQTQMGMYEVYATVLAAPVNTAFGVHEELNQDLTSHALTSAIMTWETLKIVKLAMATNFMASCQAIDLLGGPEKLSPMTQPLYHWLRKHVPYIKTEQPLGHFVERLSEQLLSSEITTILNSYTHESRE